MFQIVNPALVMLILTVILISIASFLGFLAGRESGMRCKCCSLKMDCRFCRAIRCPKAHGQGEDL